MCVFGRLFIVSFIVGGCCLLPFVLIAEDLPFERWLAEDLALSLQFLHGEKASDDEFGNTLTIGDFNGDGYKDLVISAPNKTVDNVIMAGAINVIYGSATGLKTNVCDLWHQNIAGVPGIAETTDKYGFSLVAGDFDNDGYDDLGIGILHEDLPGGIDCGALHVLPGSSTGLSSSGTQYWNQDSPGILDSVEDGDGFAWNLSVGHFNNDPYADLAVSAVFEDVDGKTGVGAVHVLYGGPSGLNSTGNQIWYQNTANASVTSKKGDYFGWSLTTADFNGDGLDDLAIGTPYKDTSKPNAGGVFILHGSNSGLVSFPDNFWTQNELVANESKENDFFGYSLTSGDFNNDGYDDLSIGTRGKDYDGKTSCGVVYTMYGTPVGLVKKRFQCWVQGVDGVDYKCENEDFFGSTLVSGNFDGDGCDDLIVGIPYKDVGTTSNAGMIYEIHGFTGPGLTASDDDQHWDQSMSSVAGSPSANDYFGQALAAGDFNNDGADDLAIGVPGDEIDNKKSGSVQILYGVPSSWDAGYTDVGSGWRQLPWIDYYAPLHNDWYNHNEHGFIYVAPVSNPGSVYIYTLDMGWLWTTRTQYPYLYRFSDNSWLWYLKGSDNPRWFKNLTSDKWERIID